MTFKQWMINLNRELVARCGMGYLDLPDVVFVRDLYDDGVPYGDVAEEILIESGFDDLW